jgi:integral membrane protein (TIGR01906 family)
MNAIRIAARWVFIILIPVLIVSATLGWAFNSLWIYEAGFSRFDVGPVIGLSSSELDRSASELIAYFNDTHQEYLDINVTYTNGVTGPLFDQADISHMKDVKGLVWLDYRLFLGAAIYILVYILASFIWNKRHGQHDLALGAAWGGGATIGLLCFLAVFAVTNFDWFFTTFHEIFFPEGNWAFPPGDHMITIFPEGFWSDVTLLVGLVALALALIVGAGGFIWLKRIRKREVAPIAG